MGPSRVVLFTGRLAEKGVAHWHIVEAIVLYAILKIGKSFMGMMHLHLWLMMLIPGEPEQKRGV